jgi:hypothetical protein
MCISARALRVQEYGLVGASILMCSPNPEMQLRKNRCGLDVEGRCASCAVENYGTALESTSSTKNFEAPKKKRSIHLPTVSKAWWVNENF